MASIRTRRCERAWRRLVRGCGEGELRFSMCPCVRERGALHQTNTYALIQQ